MIPDSIGNLALVAAKKSACLQLTPEGSPPGVHYMSPSEGGSSLSSQSEKEHSSSLKLATPEVGVGTRVEQNQS